MYPCDRCDYQDIKTKSSERAVTVCAGGTLETHSERIATVFDRHGVPQTELKPSERTTRGGVVVIECECAECEVKSEKVRRPSGNSHENGSRRSL